MANRLYIDENVGLLDDFPIISKKAYDSELLVANFENNSRQLVDEINRWIELKTENKIQNAVKQIDQRTAILLINVAFFKGKWRNRLGDVRLKEFTNLNGETKQMETICKQGYYQFGCFEKYAIAQLDYIGDSSMCIVLPNEKVALHNLLLELNARKLNEHLRELRSKELDLQLPKFKLKTELDLKDMLEWIGVDTLFNEEADLTKISNDPRLMVSKAVQNAFIEVNDDGTHATAVNTFYGITLYSNSKPPIKFYVNRPFIFLICLKGVNIFIGAVKQF